MLSLSNNGVLGDCFKPKPSSPQMSQDAGANGRQRKGSLMQVSERLSAGLLELSAYLPPSLVLVRLGCCLCVCLLLYLLRLVLSVEWATAVAG